MAYGEGLGFAIGLQGAPTDYTPIIAGNIARGEYARQQKEEKKRLANQEAINKIRERLRLQDVHNEDLDAASTQMAQYIDRISKIENNPIESEKIADEAIKEKIRWANLNKARLANDADLRTHATSDKYDPEYIRAVKQYNSLQNDKEREEFEKAHPEAGITRNKQTGRVNLAPTYKVDEVGIMKELAAVIKPTEKKVKITNEDGSFTEVDNKYFTNPEISGQMVVENFPELAQNYIKKFALLPPEKKEFYAKKAAGYELSNDPVVAFITEKFQLMNPDRRNTDTKEAQEKGYGQWKIGVGSAQNDKTSLVYRKDGDNEEIEFSEKGAANNPPMTFVRKNGKSITGIPSSFVRKGNKPFNLKISVVERDEYGQTTSTGNVVELPYDEVAGEIEDNYGLNAEWVKQNVKPRTTTRTSDNPKPTRGKLY